MTRQSRQSRWVRKDARVYDFSACQLCGTAYGVLVDGACKVERCQACGTEQCACGLSSRCGVCFHGILTGFRQEICGKKGCGKVAVAHVPRIGRACVEHLPAVKAPGAAGKRGESMAQLIAKYLSERARAWSERA